MSEDKVMSEESSKKYLGKMVLVVGVDLSDVSEHLLSNARQQLGSADQGELHVVHVVPRESFMNRISHPSPSPGASEVSGKEAAQWELKRLCSAIADGSSVKVEIHTPVGDAAQEVVRIAREVSANLVLVETHHDEAVFHISVATQIVHAAPCSVLTLRAAPTAGPKSAF
jgi:nucleotide-binding universal stress UspA family protein